MFYSDKLNTLKHRETNKSFRKCRADPPTERDAARDYGEVDDNLYDNHCASLEWQDLAHNRLDPGSPSISPHHIAATSAQHMHARTLLAPHCSYQSKLAAGRSPTSLHVR